MSADAFLEWDSGDQLTWQLIDGEPRAMAPAKRTHGILQSRLASLLDQHLERRGGPCVVVTAPGIVPRVGASQNVRVPDLAVTCTPSLDDEAVLSSPVVVIEILSRSNRHKTWSNVWTYTTIPSVLDIVVVHTTRLQADILRRRADGAWPAKPDSVTAGDLVLPSIGFREPLAALYRTTRLVT